MPIITLEVMQDGTISDSILNGTYYNDAAQQTNNEDTKPFVTQKTENATENEVPKDVDDSLKIRNDLLEYSAGSNGSVTCKLCDKVFASRSHWYRHKYRAHVFTNAPTPVPLFQCEQCHIFFKSRKGYIGHIASKHSETLQDASPVLTNAQAEALAKEKDCTALTALVPEIKKEPDPELSIPKTLVPNYQAAAPKPSTTKNSYNTPKRSLRYREPQLTGRDWEEKRSQEEKLVADIIARVRRECEATGPGPARRGYSRKPTMRT